MWSTRFLAAMAVASLAFTSSPGPSGAAAERSPDASAVSLIDQRAIEIPDSQLLALSPEGGSIAVSRPAGPEPSELCIHDVATLAERHCAGLDDLDAHLWQDSVVWSPDGEWLAFVERWPQYLVDGDLWLMDATTGTLTNLLDDGYRGDPGPTSGEDIAADGVVTLPSYPVFTPDSSALAVSLELVVDAQGSSGVATVPIAGGPMVRLDSLERAGLGSVYGRKRWAADGSRLYVSLVEYEGSGLGLDSGIWVYDPVTEAARQLTGMAEPDDWPTRIVAVSPQGEHLLVAYPHVLGIGYQEPLYALVDGTTGAVDPVVPLRPDASHAEPITGAMLSPDGSMLITVSGHLARKVAIRDLATSSETTLLTEPLGSAPSDLAGEVIGWSSDDTVLVNGGRHGRGTLLFLDRHDPSP